MLAVIDENQARRVKKLIKKSCCNCINNNCLLLDDGNAHKCKQLESKDNGIHCLYFLECVLPNDSFLYAEICEKTDKYRCENCGRLFTTKSKNRKYCDECADIVRKRKAAERQFKQREKNKQTQK